MKSELLGGFVVCVLIASLFAGPAAAVESGSENLPGEAEVGTDVEVTFEVTELFDEFEEWSLHGATELNNVTWTVKQYDQADNQIDQSSTDGTEFSTGVDIEDGVDRVEVRVTGTVPAVETYSYDPPERFLVANLTQTRSGGTDQPIDSYESHHYTAESKEARESIDGAREAVEASSSNDGQAFLESAVSSYENGNFENAIRNAERAEEEASQSQLIRTAAIGGGAVVVLLLIVGGIYRLYRSRQQGPSRLK